MENFIQNLKPLELQGFSKCVKSYHKHATMEPIISVGFNDNSGNIYISLENGITIYSSFGDDCQYMIIDDDGDEKSFDDYDETLRELNKDENSLFT